MDTTKERNELIKKAKHWIDYAIPYPQFEELCKKYFPNKELLSNDDVLFIYCKEVLKIP